MTIRWWEVPLLWFVPKRYIYSDGCVFHFKQMFGRIYLVGCDDTEFTQGIKDAINKHDEDKLKIPAINRINDVDN